MNRIEQAARGRRGLMARAVALTAAAFLMIGVAGVSQPAHAAAYVGSELSDVKPEDKATVANPQPVQIIFTFSTKGAPNAKATKYLKAKVIEAVQATGFFSEVSENPVASGAILNVVIDNVVPPGAMGDAAAKGAVTGATMFIAGSNIRDFYEAKVEYVAGPNAEKITRTAKHSVVMQMGLINSAPKDAVKVGKMDDAIYTMTRQIVTNPLNDIAKDPGFAGAPAAAPAVEAAPAAAPAAEAAPAEPAAQPAPVAEPAPAADAKPKA